MLERLWDPLRIGLGFHVTKTTLFCTVFRNATVEPFALFPALCAVPRML